MIHTEKVALITGGAKRIGRSISTWFHQAGYRVIIHYHHSRQDADTLADIFNAQRPNSAMTLQADLQIINHAAQLHTFCDAVKHAFGRLDVLVHNASSFYSSSMLAGTDELQAHWEDLFLTNAKAPFFLSHAFTAELQKTQGCIISLLDIHAEAKPFLGYPIYNMAKAAHRMMVQSLALELAPKIRINGVAPGVNIFPENNSNAELNADTQATLLDSVPLSRIGTPDDIAQAVLFLAQANYITGQVLSVDGGRSLTLKGG